MQGPANHRRCEEIPTNVKDVELNVVKTSNVTVAGKPAASSRSPPSALTANQASLTGELSRTEARGEASGGGWGCHRGRPDYNPSGLAFGAALEGSLPPAADGRAIASEAATSDCPDASRRVDFGLGLGGAFFRDDLLEKAGRGGRWGDWSEVPGQCPGPLRRAIERERIRTVVSLTAINRDDPKYVAQAKVSRNRGQLGHRPDARSRATLEQMSRWPT